MITYLLRDRIPDTWEPSTVMYIFCFEILIEAPVVAYLLGFIRSALS